MEEQITAVLTQHAAGIPGAEIQERVKSEIHKLNASFERLVKSCGYEIAAEVTGEGTLEVRFLGGNGQVYTTYTFYNVIGK